LEKEQTRFYIMHTLFIFKNRFCLGRESAISTVNGNAAGQTIKMADTSSK
jgi:hypothetical protein